MKPRLGLSLVLLLCAGAASAQVTTTKYGLAHPNDQAFRKVFSLDVVNRVYDASDFQGSYQYTRSRPDSPTPPPDCGQGSTSLAAVDRDYVPVLGQVLLTENQSCVPTSTGPTCSAGTNIGAPCHLPVGLTTLSGSDAHARAPFILAECGTAGVCTIAPGTSCQVTIAKTTDTTPTAQRTDYFAPVVNKNPLIGLQILSAAVSDLGGTSGALSPSGVPCLGRNIQPEPTTGQRYLLPASRGGNGTRTFIRWNEDPSADLAADKTTSLYQHIGNGRNCCNSATNTLCAAVGPWPEYDTTGLLNEIDCTNVADSVTLRVQTPDWIFAGGPATNFQTDAEFVMPGQRVGVCRANRAQELHHSQPGPRELRAADRLLDARRRPVTPGVQPDTCDFRENGIRATRPRNLPNGYPDTAQCGINLYVLRGTANANCILLPGYRWTAIRV